MGYVLFAAVVGWIVGFCMALMTFAKQIRSQERFVVGRDVYRCVRVGEKDA